MGNERERERGWRRKGDVERGYLKILNKINFHFADPQAAVLPLCHANCQQSFWRHNKDAGPRRRPHFCTLGLVFVHSRCGSACHGVGAAVACFARSPSPGGLPSSPGGTHRARTNGHVLESGLYMWSPISEHQIKVPGVLWGLCSNLTVHAQRSLVGCLC